MLYERWREVVRENGRELALRDAVGGRQWSFRQLAAVVEGGVPLADAIVFPRGICAEFIFIVLRAWRSGRAVCPVEAGPGLPQFSHVPENCTHLKMTSATTGAARVVAFRADQLAADADNIVATMGLRRDWPNLGVISLAHSYGFSNLVVPLLLHGIPLILSDSQLPEAVRRASALADSLTLPGVPALWRAWHEAKAIPPNVRLAISAGAPLPLPLEREVFEDTGVKLHNFYGASECGGIAYDALASPRSDASCVGAPLQGVCLSIGEEGCLEVRSRAVGETYWPQPQSNLADGLYRTNDLAELIDGRVYLRGRAGDLINVAGRKVSPETIERELLTHPEVRDCLVFGAPGAAVARGEIVVACLVVKPGVATAELKQFLLSRLPPWQVPREWLLVDSLETSLRGKVSRTEWRRKYSEGKATCG
jgi:long-chain acyl-CoA synthetase